MAVVGEGGNYFAELLHYPVAIAANCNFPSVLKEIAAQLLVEPMGGSEPPMGTFSPSTAGHLSLFPTTECPESLRWSDLAAVSMVNFHSYFIRRISADGTDYVSKYSAADFVL